MIFYTTHLSKKMDSQIKDFVQKYSPSLHILTPCYGGVCNVSFMLSIINTIKLLEKYNIPVQLTTCCDSLISRARNNLIARAMSDPKMTHMIFIDSDISWNPSDVLSLLMKNKLLSGGLYPMKNIMWENILQENYVQSVLEKKNKHGYFSQLSDASFLEANLLKYNWNLLDKSVEIRGNLMPVRHLATGFMMIRRETIMYMQKAFPSTKYTCDINFLTEKENEHAFALFDCTVIDGHYYSEDWLFSERWNKLGGKIYADVTIALTHSGMYHYKGSFLSKIMN